jgi:hypothetical protein
MKPLFSILFLLAVFIYACNDDNENPAVDILSSIDSTASANMANELRSMSESLDSLLNTPHHNEQVHHDSMYHHHDSLYWHHHNNYNHETYNHDDHHHQWVPYDSALNHTNHFHHTYPNHEHDSLVTTPTAHVHDNTDLHHPGHDIDQHHYLDSLHTVHGLHHP